MRSIRSTLVTAAAIGSAAIGGAAIANAATSSTTSTTPAPSTSGQSPPGQPAPGRTPPAFNPSQGGHTVGGKTEKLLTGDVAAKVRAAALAKVSGTVERVETNVDDSTPYEAHIIKSDGSQVIVEVDANYSVVAVKTMGSH